jgi:hypothetical protein
MGMDKARKLPRWFWWIVALLAASVLIATCDALVVRNLRRQSHKIDAPEK